MGIVLVSLAPLVFIVLATWAVLKIAMLMIRLCFLPVTVLLVLRRPRY